MVAKPEEGALVVGVLGLGHVGLPTALTFAELGWPVVGTDQDRTKVERITSGKVPFYEPGLEELLRKHLGRGFCVNPDVEQTIREANILFICVLSAWGHLTQNPDGSPDLSQVENVARTIASNLNGYKLIVEKSTVPVLTAGWIKRTIERYKSNPSLSFDVACNPEFLQEGRALEDCLHPERVVLGVETEQAKELLLQIYQPLVKRGLPPDRLIVTDTRTAELIKHTANAFLAMRISFINMVADLCEAVGADIKEVARGKRNWSGPPHWTSFPSGGDWFWGLLSP